jgi:hypothetical protein
LPPNRETLMESPIAAGPSSATIGQAIPWSQIGAKAGADYKGDGLSLTPAEKDDGQPGH